jgi:hypothetical protein
LVQEYSDEDWEKKSVKYGMCVHFINCLLGEMYQQGKEGNVGEKRKKYRCNVEIGQNEGNMVKDIGS